MFNTNCADEVAGADIAGSSRGDLRASSEQVHKEKGVPLTDDAQIEEALSEIRQGWVELNKEIPFENHRVLITYFRDLQVMIFALRDYSKDKENYNRSVVKAVQEYVVKAHSSFSVLLEDWIQLAETKEREHITIPALARMRRLRSQFEQDITEELGQYCEKNQTPPRKDVLPTSYAVDEEYPGRSRATTKGKFHDMKMPAAVLPISATRKPVQTNLLWGRGRAREINACQDERRNPRRYHYMEKSSDSSSEEESLTSKKERDYCRMNTDFFNEAETRKKKGWMESERPWFEKERTQGAYEQGHLEGRMHAKFSAMYEMGGRDVTRRFDGKRSDYPMFRQQLLRDYQVLWSSDPYILLQRIANTVSDSVYEHIKNAWIMRNPQDALNRIWEILEDLYGDPRELLDSAIREIKWTKGSLGNNVASMQLYRTQLRNLDGVAKSIDRQQELSRPKLLFRIVDCFNTALCNQFTQENKDFRNWRFNTILQFLDDQISNLQFRERHTYDISSIIGENDKFKRQERPPQNRSRREYSGRVNNVREVHAKVDSIKPSGDAEKNNQGHRRDTEDMFCAIHFSHSHSILECRIFLGMAVEERRSTVMRHGLCFYCLKKHLARHCPSKRTCTKCNGGHSDLLHLERKEKNNKKDRDHEGETSQQADANLNSIKTYTSDTPSVPLIALRAIKHQSKDSESVIPFYALIDTGADITLCTKELAESLFDWNPRESISIKLLENKPEEHTCMKQTIKLKFGDKETVEMQNVPFMDMQLPYSQCIPDTETLLQHGFSEDCFPVVHGERRIDMILGAQDLRRFQVLETVKWNSRQRCKPLLGKHPLGTIYWGMKIDTSNQQYVCAVHASEGTHYTQQLLELVTSEHNISEKEGLEYMPLLVHDLARYYQDQNIIDPDSEELTMSKDDEKILSFYRQNIMEVYDQKGQKRLQLPLPWKEGYPVKIPYSLQIAKRRLNAQVKRMSTQPDKAKKYRNTFTEMKEQGHAERVKATDETEITHYITHFATDQEKFRVVYNGALKVHGLSINDMLHRGPMFLEPLVGILVRFRQYQFAISGDIKNMFFQITLDPKDRNMLRFMPYTGETVGEDTETWRFTVMPYGLISIPSIAGFCIKYTAHKNYVNVSSKTIQRVEQDFYVDDLITSVNSLEEACEIIEEAKSLLKTTGFKLTKFSSNSREVLASLSPEELAPKLKSLDLSKDGLPSQKTLGISWNSDKDELQLRGGKPYDTPPLVTRRTALSSLNSYFDPLGLWCPFFVKLKCCYSKLATSTEGWDDEVNQQLQKEWNELLGELGKITSLAVPRLYSSLTDKEIELHMFSDASEIAMGGCVYIRKTNGNLSDSMLVLGKARIFSQTRIAKFSIARKELVALSMAVDLLQQCKRYLTVPITKTYLWVDSETVIKWCKCANKPLPIFVRNRVDKILRVSSNQLPNYVESKNNPADIASRGIGSNQLDKFEFWMKGPEFLRQPKETWNVKRETHVQPSNAPQCVTESEPCLANVQTGHDLEQETLLLKGLSTSTTSNEAEQLLMLVRRCFLGWKHGRKQGENKKDSERVSLHQTRMLLLKLAQEETMGYVLANMKRRKCTFEEALPMLPTGDRKPYLTQMTKYVPFLSQDDDLLRVGGRLQNSDFDLSFKHPIILPYRHWTTKLYVEKRHALSSHLGPNYVFGCLQAEDGLWPMGGTSTVRHYLKDCFGCKIRRQVRGKQLMAPLPSVRLKPKCNVFTYAASDLAGPFLVAIGRGTVKRWLCVFVCMVTTAVRVEIAADLTASAFINAFRRFLCSTGFKTKFIRTDNGTNFVGANNVLKREVKAALATIHEEVAVQNKFYEWEVEWEFGPPGASHHGGIYERQIRTIRQALNALSGISARKPSDDEFNTCAKMAEYIMNCRPLTKSVSDDGLPPLRPIDLMVGALEPTDTCIYPSVSSPNDVLRKGHKYTQSISHIWWDRWYKLYVPSLQERQKWTKPHRDFSIGDLVIVQEETPPRFLKYPYALVTDVKKGTDGHVRSVSLRSSDGRTKDRDITKLVLINAVDD